MRQTRRQRRSVVRQRVLSALLGLSLALTLAANWPSTSGTTAAGVVLEDGAGNKIGTSGSPVIVNLVSGGALTSPVITGTVSGSYALTGATSLNGYVPTFYVTQNSCTPSAAGTGYVPGDVATLTGGTFTTAAKCVVIGTKVVSATVAAGGSGGTNGTQTVTGTTGTGTKFQASVTVSGNAITAVLSITVAGDYTVNPTSLTAEPVTGASLSGAQLNVVMGAVTGQLQIGGKYSVAGTTPLAESATTGSGTGATWTVAFSPFDWQDYNHASTEGLLVSATRYGNGAGSSITTATELAAYGLNACHLVTTGVEDTCLGWLAGAAYNGSFSVFVGNGVYLAGTSGNANTMMGAGGVAKQAGALSSATLIGANILKNLTTQTAIDGFTGVGSGTFQNWTGANGNPNNTAVGLNTAKGGTSASFIGVSAIGASAFTAATSGGSGVGVGNSACSKVTTGSNNHCYGFSVGSTTLTTGTSNLLIGVSSGVDTAASNTTHGLVIATTSQTAASNTVNMEGVLTVTGTDTPSTSAASHAGTLAVAGITTDATHTDSAVCQDTTTHVFYAGSGAAGICLGTSSARFKHEITALPPVLGNKLLALEPISYHYNEGYGDPSRKLYGFTAEQVHTVLPELVGLDTEGRPNSVDWAGLVPVIVSQLQSQQAEIAALRKQINAH